MTDNRPSDKKKFNGKRLIYSLGYFVIIAVVAFISAGGFSNTPDWGNVIRKIITSWAMTAALMYLSYNDKLLAIQDDFKSLLTTSVASVRDRSEKIYRMGLSFAFTEYTHNLYEKRRERFLMSKMDKIGITDKYILVLTFEQLTGLTTKPLLINGHAFDVLTPEQYAEIIKIKNGKYEYMEIPSDYFLTASSNINTDVYSHYANITAYRATGKFKQIAIKMGMMAVFATAFALVVPPAKDQMLELITAMLATTANGVGGLLTGILWARKDAMDFAAENDFKISSVDEFYSDYTSGVFVPTQITDVVKQKLLALADLEDEYEEDDEQML